ncbi:phosphomevalonate kinase [Frankliniella occidentalis]|uniref:Phosphomevalonate kinase n=1 Tax=Frankliniella occidentalis TaxID=133901 RepID=A0A6J1SS25_FRAOC|nr:phosphomevalonate kinase [Frankliniella occidentalis]KAE8753006.1 phosphomevalonate kinase [Frankliniella occidentalis]
MSRSEAVSATIGRGTGNPKRVFLFSGKRKCGKDYITDLLLERIGEENTVIIKISSPIKSHWAEEKGLDLHKLMSANQYKENFRQDMIIWSESVRAKDPGYFCRKAVDMYKAQEKPIWVVSDIRRKTDIKWFTEEYGDAVRTVRVVADESVRQRRGYVFTKGVDDIASECDLDDVLEWNWSIINNGDESEVDRCLKLFIDDIESVL